MPIENDLTWHDINYQMSHWPVDKQPYLNARYGDYDKSTATWPSQVSHSSLIGVEAKGTFPGILLIRLIRMEINIEYI